MTYRLRFFFSTSLGFWLLALSGNVLADQLFNPKTSTSLVSDRRASQEGDLVTVVITETSSATNSASSSTAKNTGLSGQFNSVSGHQVGGGATLGNSWDGQGTVERSGKVLAQISVHVDTVLPNGDLLVAGAQAININGEKTNIRVKGRIRPSDIAGDNTIPSNRLADAVIAYDGQGYITDNVRPGWIPRFWNWVKPW